MNQEAELTNKQIARQDFVDNQIFNLLRALNPRKNTAFIYNGDVVGNVRDAVAESLAALLEIQTGDLEAFDAEFYPFARDENPPRGEIKIVTSDEELSIIETSEPRGLFLRETAFGGFVAIDNRDGDAFTEYFDDEQTATSWLNGEFELGESEG